MRIKAIYIKNLKMPEGKLAAQVAHAVKNLGITPTDCDIVVLGVSTKKFGEMVRDVDRCYIQIDKGLTVVEAGTMTAAAWIESGETTEFEDIRASIITQLGNIKYKSGDLSDMGNEIGIAIGKYTMGDNALDVDDFIAGLRHGVSLIDGTH